jgi:putative heme-binding domain-containing protein
VISDQYAAKRITTTRGRTYTGIVTRNAGQTIVLTPDGKKVGLADSEIDEIHASKVSAMPEGLLDELSLEEVRDLFAFLSDVPRTTTARSAGSTSQGR